jgi:hypothetical protein
MARKNKETARKSSLAALAEAAFEQASRMVIQRARQTGTPVIVWKNGRIEEVSADQMETAMDKDRINKARARGSSRVSRAAARARKNKG